MFRRLWKRPAALLAMGAAAMVLVGAGAAAGWFAAEGHRPGVKLPEIPLHATGAARSESLAMATGRVDGDAEGLFVLDYITGQLQCFVMNPRTRVFTAHYTANVAADLGAQQGKTPEYVMVTGDVNFIGAQGNMRPAQTVVYVADANSGNFVAYGIVWNRQAFTGGAPIQGPLVTLDKGKARNLQIRD